MNDRIKKLIEQSGISVYKKPTIDKHFPELYDSAYFEGSPDQLEKFTELVVRRVISVYNDTDTFKTSVHDDNRVLEYFGVE